MTRNPNSAISFVGLGAQREIIGEKLDHAIARVFKHGQFINGPEVGIFEENLAAFSGVREVVTCGSGTDALKLTLLAWNIGRGDAVFVPSFTFVATAEVVALLQATPIFVDVDEVSYNMNPESLILAVGLARKQGLAPRVVIPVDLFGQPACYDEINEIAEKNALKVLADAAQSFGGSFKNQKVGSLASATATSFFPTKPLGSYGDGGAILTNDDALARVLRSLRAHGGGRDRYDNVRIGTNSRLDTLQAAILIEKLPLLENEIMARNEVAMRYSSGIKGLVRTPVVMPDRISAWAHYTVQMANRTDVSSSLKVRGVPTAIYYPKPLHLQVAYQKFPCAPGGLRVSERLAESVLSLPMHPYLQKGQQDFVIEGLMREFYS